MESGGRKVIANERQERVPQCKGRSADNKSERKEKVVDSVRLRRITRTPNEWKAEEERMEQI